MRILKIFKKTTLFSDGGTQQADKEEAGHRSMVIAILLGNKMNAGMGSLGGAGMVLLLLDGVGGPLPSKSSVNLLICPPHFLGRFNIQTPARWENTLQPTQASLRQRSQRESPPAVWKQSGPSLCL